MFKSYYVVWKPQIAANPKQSLQEGLNRTMQYGNQFKITRKVRKYQSLNRTMQYGNLLKPVSMSVFAFSLNRTMQYGNQSKEIDNKEIIKFKSYYVVWKRR